jgi:hypothetical protein
MKFLALIILIYLGLWIISRFMKKSEKSYTNEDVSIAATKWCDIERVLEPYLFGKGLLDWVEAEGVTKACVLRKIAGMQNGYIFFLFMGKSDDSLDFFKEVIAETHEYGSIFGFSSIDEHMKYHTTNSKSNLHEYFSGLELGREEASDGTPNFLNYVKKVFEGEKIDKDSIGDNNIKIEEKYEEDSEECYNGWEINYGGEEDGVCRQMNVDQSCKFLRDTYLPEGVFL